MAGARWGGLFAFGLEKTDVNPPETSEPYLRETFSRTVVATPETNPPRTPPEWFSKHSLAKQKGYLYGYGRGKTEGEAKAQSLKQISEQIAVKVEAESSSRRRSRSEDGTNASSATFEDEVRTFSQAELRDAERINRELKDGIYYVLYRWDNRPLRLRVAEWLQPLEEGETFESPFLVLPFYASLYEMGKRPDFDLFFKGGSWQIATGDRRTAISPREWFEGFFAESRHRHLALEVLPSHELKQDDFYSLKVRTNAGGYLSLFQVLQNGQVLRLGSANVKVEAKQTTVFPDPENYEGMVAENLTEDLQVRDLAIAVLCENVRPGLTKYVGITEQNVDDASLKLYSYPDLIEQSEGCALGSRFLFIAKESPRFSLSVDGDPGLNF